MCARKSIAACAKGAVIVPGDIGAWLEILGCPYCHRALQLVEVDDLACVACGQHFAVRGGIPLLVRHEEVAALATFSQRYAEERRQEGWRSMSAAQARALPYGSPNGYPVLYWEVRRQTFASLLRLLSEEGP